MTTSITLVDWDDPDALRLRTAQQAELLALYGEEDIGAAMTGESIVAMLLVRVDGQAVACGAIRDASGELGEGVGELKRMFVAPEHRGRGHSRAVVRELERVAAEKGFRRLVLETGVLQASAIGLYLSEDYRSIPNFGEYATESESRCFAKDLGPTPPRVPRSGERPTVTVTHTDWSDPVAEALRLAMWRDIEVRYPEVVEMTPGGFAVDDPAQGVGALSTVVAWIGPASPRSITRTIPAAAIRFAGFTSPCATPISCRSASASPTSRAARRVAQPTGRPSIQATTVSSAPMPCRGSSTVKPPGVISTTSG